MSTTTEDTLEKTTVADRSPDWDSRDQLIIDKPNQRIEGFPFSVPFPKMYGGQTYEIILSSGRKLSATVDDAREFYSEGLEWKTSEGNKEQAFVAAWKLKA
ncbi:MAG: hypothetical protein JWM20_612 [Patescibacteria group bacterium]|nr:hypothetical protein [Patescibacteria group bacterium]